MPPWLARCKPVLALLNNRMRISDIKDFHFTIEEMKGRYAKDPSLAYHFLVLDEEITIEGFTDNRVMLSSTLAAIAHKKRNKWSQQDLLTFSKSDIVLEHNDDNHPILFAKVSASGTPLANGFAEALRAFLQK